MNPLLAFGAAAAAISWAEKQDWWQKLPSLPVVGKKGTLAGLAYYAAGASPAVAAVAPVVVPVAIALGAAEYVRTGQVTGRRVAGQDETIETDEVIETW